MGRKIKNIASNNISFYEKCYPNININFVKALNWIIKDEEIPLTKENDIITNKQKFIL